jgi:Ca2+-binding EF-hand superfamily protein
MRLTRSQCLLLALFSLSLLISSALSQGPGDPGRGGDQGGRTRFGGGGGPPTDFIFAILAGKDKEGKINETIDVSKVEAPPFSPESTEKLREKLNGFMRSKGISGSTLNKEQFSNYFNEVARPEMEKSENKRFFDFSDSNKDGKLSRDEIEASSKRWGRGPSPLLERFSEFDKNKDGVIDLEEYSAYMVERRTSWQKEREQRETKREEPKKESTSTGGSTDGSGYRTAPATATAPPPSTDGRPLVFRYGKLPTRDLPSWFVDLDTDKDGQVGLYEWRSGGKLTSEFRKYDINADGFLTAEEVMLVQKNDDAKEAKAVTFARVYADPLLDGGATTLPTGSGSTATKGKNDKSKDDKGKDDKGKRNWWDKGGGKGGKRP